MSVWMLYCALMALFVALLLLAESLSNQPLKIGAKACAAATFLWAGFSSNALDSTWGMMMLGGLVLSALGDCLLLSTSVGGLFLGGLISFLLAHVCYALAFAYGPQDWLVVAALLTVMIALGIFIYGMLVKGIEPSMQRPVQAYILVIGVMTALAYGSWSAGGLWVLPCAATAFWMSDISVARERFLNAGFLNKLWGIPLYFGAQLLFAYSLHS